VVWALAKGISLLVNQNEQQLVFQFRQNAFDPAAALSLPRLAFHGFIRRILAVILCRESWQKPFKCRVVNSQP
jgi:hypothetical protein